ncbi:MAG: L-aspartate oxidase [Planctomycetes bacterium]|nr:L-aspartate oxidase [Planctomycetota bacterium]
MHAIFEDRRYLIPFRSALLPQIFTDVLVVGSGVAGLSAAMSASAHSDVIVLAKSAMDLSNTAWAQGGIAAVVDEGDTTDSHIRETLEAGAGLCDEPVVRRIIEAGPERVQQLIKMGMPFDRDESGALALGREGGQSAHRILHADGDATGHALAQTMIRAIARHDRVRVFDHCFALDLLTDPSPGETGGRCLGAITHHPKYGLQVIWAKATILASGGCGQIYRETTNPPVATGDGMAMAYRAGAKLADMEFVQFHPTVLYIAGASRALISEAVRGEGAYLVDRRERRFMLDVHELAELAPRDIVARAINRQITSGIDASVYLDARHIGRERFTARFPGITALLARFDLDPSQDLIPIRPAAHYMCGGVWVDEQARTNIPGLYACGEVACTGLHGANRLASNSLLEGLVCGNEAGAACHESVSQAVPLPMKIVSDIRPSDRSELDLPDVLSTLRSVMWRHVGIERSGSQLEDVSEMYEFWARYTLDKIFDDRTGWQVQNMLLIGALITQAANWRTESRGAHYRTDFPHDDPNLRMHACWQHGLSEAQTLPVRDPIPAVS